MSKTMKRPISFLLAMVMVLGMIPSAFALEPEENPIPENQPIIEQIVDADKDGQEDPGLGDGIAEETTNEDELLSDANEIEDLDEKEEEEDLSEENQAEIIEDSQEPEEPAEEQEPTTFQMRAPVGEFHVKNNGGNDSAAGTHEAPFMTIGAALRAAAEANMTDVTICLDSDIQSGLEVVFDDPSMNVTIKSCEAPVSIKFMGTRPIGNESGFMKVVDGANVTFENVTLKASEGNYDGRVVYVADDGVVTLDSVTVTKGKVKEANYEGRGGAGLFADDHGTAYIKGDSLFTDNETVGGGGAVYAADGGYIEISGNTSITNNRAANGGGVYAMTQTGEYGGLKIMDTVTVSKNTATENGSGMFIEQHAKACVAGEVVISGNMINRKPNNVYLAENATLDISGTTLGANIGISADPEFAYRLVSLPVDDHEIIPTQQGDESAWTDDCGKWDIRHMTYNGVEGLYLYYKTLGAIFNDVTTVTDIEGKNIDDEIVDFMDGDKAIPGAEFDGGELTVPGVIAKGDGEDYVIDITCDKDEYRITTPDMVVVTDGDKTLEQGVDYTYEPDYENGTAQIVLKSEAKDKLTGPVRFEISAEKLYTLTVQANGPLYAMTTSITEHSMKPLAVTSKKEGAVATYNITRNGAGVAGVTVELHKEGTNEPIPAVLTDENGLAVITGLDADSTYYPILKYAESFRVIKRDEIAIDPISTLPGQTLAAEAGMSNGDMDYRPGSFKATITNVHGEAVATISVEQAMDTIVFWGNEDHIDPEVTEAVAPATITLGDTVGKGSLTKEMPASSMTVGEMPEATMTGYTFAGWFATKDCEGEAITAATAYAEGKYPNLWAKWIPNDDTAYQIEHWVEVAESEYGVNVNKAGEAVNGYYLYETTNDTGTSDAIADLSESDLKTMASEAYEWWTRNGFTAHVQDEPCRVLADGTAVFKIFYDRNIYDVTFKTPLTAGTAVNDEEIPTQTVKFGDVYGELPDPKLPGYNYDHNTGVWYDGDRLVTETTIHIKTEDVELSAKWNANENTKWAIKVATQDIAKDKDGKFYTPGTYTEYKTVYLDNDGKLLEGITDTTIEFNIADIDQLTFEGFNYVGYADELDKSAANKIDNTISAEVYVKPTDMSTDKNGDFNNSFDGGIVWLYYDRMTKTPTFEDGQGNKTEDKDPIIYGGDFTGHLPPDPGKDGYDFDNWADPNGDPVDEKTPADKYVTEDGELNIHPEWTARKYNLTYVPGNKGKFIASEGTTGEVKLSDKVAGGYIDPNEVTYDEKMGAMPSAYKKGYDFDGWFVDGKQITEETVVTVDNVVISNANEEPPYGYENTRPLYAQYTPHTYTLVLIPGKSSVTGEAGSVTPERITVTYDQAVAGLPTPTLRGYRFVSWVLDKADPSSTVRNGNFWDREYTNGAEIPLYATWLPESYRYTFNLNDQKGSTRGQLVDTTIDYVDETFDAIYDRIFAVEAIRPGYNFKGWSLLPTGDVLTADDLVKLSENRVLYAIWEPKLYDVKLVMKGGQIADLRDNSNLETYDPTAVYDAENDTWIIKVAFDSVYGELPVPVKTDCTYHGYLADAPGWPAKEGYGVTIHEQIITNLPQYIDFEDKDGIVLTAVLEPWFTFDPDGGKFVEDNTTEPKKEIQSDIDKLPEVEKPGYTHKGWKDEDDNPVSLEDVKNGEEPKELKPIYVPNVTLDPDGGKFVEDGTTDPKEIPIDELDKLPDTKKDGYVQEGWVDENGNPVTEEDIKNSEEPITVKPAYFASIIMDANGGKVNGKDRDEVRLSTLATLPALSRNNYTFNGWFSEKDGGVQVDLEALKAANLHTTIWAHWTYDRPSGGGGGGGGVTITDPKTPLAPLLDVTFKVEGQDDKVVSTPRDSLVTPPKNVAPVGYKVIGWYTDEKMTKEWDLSKDKVTEDMILWGKLVYLGPFAFLTSDHIAYIQGMPDGRIYPGANITRAEVAMIFYRLLNDETRAQYKTDKNAYDDVNADDWFNVAVSTLTSMGVLKGRGNNVFDPTANITRAEFAVICSRVDVLDESQKVSFPDVPDTHWASREIRSASAKGWVKGYDNGLFGPEDEITRASVVTLINRMLQRANENGKLDMMGGEVNGDKIRIYPDSKNPYNWFYTSMQEATHAHDHEMKGDVEVWTEIHAPNVSNQ